ncbi:hypothetical protein [Brevundimonas faecalis]|uniref:UrcA family protein n=1 Tax=Brevundimonas faecalis TaxID=947378 RepID=A0ABV2RD89_9CAUL
MILIAFAAALLAGQDATPREVEVSAVAPASANNPGALPNQPQPGERLICRTEPVLGSNRRQRVCMTAEQRARLREESREYRNAMDQPYNPDAGAPKGGG